MSEKALKIATDAQTFNDGFKGESSDMKMILISAHGDQIERKMTSKSIEVDGDGDKSIITFNWPLDVKGTKMLTWSHRSENDDQWLYLPALKLVKRISSRNKTGSFMGSEFSYEDLGSQEVEKYTYNYLREDVIDGRKVDVYERFSVDKKSGYSKQIIFQDREYKNALKIEYFDRKKELLKIAIFNKYIKIGKWFRPGMISIKNIQTKKSSILTFENRKLSLSFSSRDFKKNSLKR